METETLEQLHARLSERFGADAFEIVTNSGPAAQHSLLITAAAHPRAREIALFLRDDPATQLDYCSNVSGVDWPPKPAPKPKPAAPADSQQTPPPPPPPVETGYLEAVYHLYSMARKTKEPLVLRLRTANRNDSVTVPSLTPVWRACELQEREVFDLYGIVFEGHPDLRRLLMWDEYKDHPMRKDYVSPDDYEWEPTPHDEVLSRAQGHYPAAPTTEVSA